MKRSTKLALSLVASTMLFTGCGGGLDNKDTSRTNVPAQVQDGTINNPAKLSLNLTSKLSEDTSKNYFKFTGKKGGKLVLDIHCQVLS